MSERPTKNKCCSYCYYHLPTHLEFSFVLEANRKQQLSCKASKHKQKIHKCFASPFTFHVLVTSSLHCKGSPMPNLRRMPNCIWPCWMSECCGHDHSRSSALQKYKAVSSRLSRGLTGLTYSMQILLILIMRNRNAATFLNGLNVPTHPESTVCHLNSEKVPVMTKNYPHFCGIGSKPHFSILLSSFLLALSYFIHLFQG